MTARMRESLKGVGQGMARVVAGAWLLAVSARQALAALPTAVPPSTGDPGGDWLKLIKGYMKDGGDVLGLVFAVAAFLWVAWIVIAKFNEARVSGGRVEWGELGLTAGAGAAVLLFIAYLLNQATEVIEAGT